MNKKLRLAGTFFGATAVILGAFGAHGLETHIDSAAIDTYKTGVMYQFYHTFLLLIVSFFALNEKTKRILFWLLVIGILCFSGSIYFLATNTVTAFDFKILGPVTPLGGTLLIAAWIVLFVNFLKKGGDN